MADNSDDSGDEINGQGRPVLHNKLWTPYKILREEQKENFFEKNSFWKVKFSNETDGGKKTYYYCNALGRLQNRCPAEICVFERKETTDNVVTKSGEHAHDDTVIVIPKTKAIIYKKIKRLLKGGMKQRQISHQIRTCAKIGIKPTENQVKMIK